MYLDRSDERMNVADSQRPPGRGANAAGQMSDSSDDRDLITNASLQNAHSLGYETRPQARSSRLRWIYAKLFKQSSDMENASVNHQYTAAEKEKLNTVESIDYLPSNSAVYRAWAEKQDTK